MLFRALVHVRQPPQTRNEDIWPEVHVFFESTRPERAKDDARLMLGFAWGIPHTDVRVQDIYSDLELRQRATGGELDGDIALFEIHALSGPTYCEMGRTLFFVTPTSVDRLIHAQCMASMRSARLGANRVISQRHQRRTADGAAHE